MRFKKVVDDCKKFGGTCLDSLFRFCVGRLNIVIAVLAGILLVVTSLVFLWAYDRTEDLLVEQMLHRQQLTGRAGAKSLVSIVQMAAASIADLADNTAVKTGSNETQAVLDNYIDRWSFNHLSGVTLMDTKGIVTHHASLAGSTAVGSDVSDRDYFRWAKSANAGDVYISDPIISRFGQSQDNTILVYSTPIVVDGEFSGSISSAYILTRLANDYLEPLRATHNTRIQLINEQGTLIYSSYPNLIGENMFEQIANNATESNIEFSNALRSVIENRGEKKFNVVLSTPATEKPEQTLIAITPVRYLDNMDDNGGRYWYLALATTADDAHIFMGQFLESSTALIVITVVIVLVLTLLIIVLVRVAQRDAYLEGFVIGRDQMKRRSKKWN